MYDEHIDDTHDPEIEEDLQNLPHPPRENDANWTRRRLEYMNECRFLAEVQRALCDIVGDAVEGVRPAEQYLPLLKGLLCAWDEHQLPRGCACGMGVDEG